MRRDVILGFHDFLPYACTRSFALTGDNCVSKDEFVAGFQSKFGATEEQANKIFPKLDSDGDGNINLDELRVFFKQMDGDGE